MSKFIMSKRPNVHIIQPIIPEYRVDFFMRLDYFLGDKLYIYCSPSWPESPKSVFMKINNFHYKLKVINFKNKIFFQSFWPLIKRIKKNDVVVLSGNLRIISNYLIVFYCKVVSAKIIWWGHGRCPSLINKKYDLRKIVMGCTNGILLYTDEEKESFEKNNYIKKPIFALNNGINIDEVDKHFKANWCEFSKRGNNVIFCGRLTKKSNILLLLKAIKKSTKINKLIVVGDGELFDDCNEYIINNNMKESVEMLGAIYAPQELTKIFSKASLFVYPGKVGLSIVHAMAHGLPVVLHDNRNEHCPENIVANLNNAIFFEKDSDKSLSMCIDNYFSYDKSEQVRLAKNARETVEISFNTKGMADRFLDMLNIISKV